MSSKVILCAFIASLFFAASTQAQAPKKRWTWAEWKKSPPEWATAEDRHAAEHLRNMGLWISGCNEAPPDPSHNYKYVWQVKIAQAIRAEGEIDTPEEKARLQRIWKRFDDIGYFDIQSVQFDVQGGSLLKYAAIRNHTPFVNFAAEYKLSLTKVDEGDGGTVLDYLTYHIQRVKGSELEKELRDYYDKLRNAGAVHRRELP